LGQGRREKDEEWRMKDENGAKRAGRKMEE
jgi:hypothetical protein